MTRTARTLMTTLIVALLSSPAHAFTSTLVAAGEVGITAESLVVAGMTSAEATTIVTRIQDATVLRAELAAANDAASTAASTVTALREAILEEGADGDQYDDLIAAEAALAEAVADGANVRTAILVAALDGCASEKIQRLDNFRTAAAYRVEPAMRALLRSGDQWAAVEGAMRQEARAVRRGNDVPAEIATLLAGTRTDQVTIDAAARLASDLATMQAIIAQFD